MGNQRIALLSLLLSVSCLSRSQTPGSTSVGGGTLAYEVTTTTGTCSNERESWTETEFSKFSFTTGSTTTQLGGFTANTFVNGGVGNCSGAPTGAPTLVTLTLPNGTPSNISVTQSTGRAALITATITTTADPTYKVISILYAAPGNESSTSFTNSTTNGTVTSTSSSFQVSDQLTFTYGFAFGSASASYGFSSTTGMSDAFTETVTDGTSIANHSNSSSPNTVDHNNDLFLLWLNPEVTASSTQYTVQNKAGEVFDPVFVYASELQANSSGGTSVTASHLNKQYDSATGSNDLPGVANICSSISGPNPNLTYVAQYASLSCTQATQCGCVPSDFSNLIKLDPLVSLYPSSTPDLTTATSPLAADVSGQLCSSPTASDNCRYAPVECSAINCYFTGPSTLGGNNEATTWTQTDSSQTVLTYTDTISESTGVSLKAGTGVGRSLMNTETFTWTDSESEGPINGVANQIAYSLESNTVGCSEHISVFEDTVFHTFVLQQVGSNSCP